MDDYERTTRSIRTEEVIPAEPVVPVAATPVYPANPIAPAGTPIVAATPVMAARPAVADRVVTEHESVRTTPTGLEMGRRIVGLVFGILQALLIIRIILLLLVANRENDIVQFILGVTSPFVNPFRDMFSLNQIGSRGSVLDIAAIVAIVAWTLVELLIFAILNLGSRRRTTVY
jgi:uncharacterized protein YggT (Ycf19 family)